MKKLSEVTKMTGVSRRSLQEYDRLNLVNPSGKTDAGYWLYDDEAIQRILFIQLLAEVGYERKQIQTIVNNPDLDAAEVLEDAIAALEEKRKKLGGMINMAKAWLTATKLPESTLLAMGHMDVSRLCQNNSFSDSLKKSVAEASVYTDEEVEEAEKYGPLYYHIIAIGYMKEYDPKVKLVQDCVNEFYRFFIEIYEEDEEEKMSEAEIYSEEMVDVFIELLRDDILVDQEFSELITLQCGEGATEYICKALEIFKKLVIKGYWNKK